jgi:hypothetical protein
MGPDYLAGYYIHGWIIHPSFEVSAKWLSPWLGVTQIWVQIISTDISSMAG